MAVAEWFLRKVLARIASDAKVPVSQPRSPRERADIFRRTIEQLEREQHAAAVVLPALRAMLREAEEENRLETAPRPAEQEK